MDKYLVAIGGENFEVDANDNQGARYSAAAEFKAAHPEVSEASLTSIANYAKARMVTQPRETGITTKELIKLLKAEIKEKATV